MKKILKRIIPVFLALAIAATPMLSFAAEPYHSYDYLEINNEGDYVLTPEYKYIDEDHPLVTVTLYTLVQDDYHFTDSYYDIWLYGHSDYADPDEDAYLYFHSFATNGNDQDILIGGCKVYEQLLLFEPGTYSFSSANGLFLPSDLTSQFTDSEIHFDYTQGADTVEFKVGESPAMYMAWGTTEWQKEVNADYILWAEGHEAWRNHEKAGDASETVEVDSTNPLLVMDVRDIDSDECFSECVTKAVTGYDSYTLKMVGGFTSPDANIDMITVSLNDPNDVFDDSVVINVDEVRINGEKIPFTGSSLTYNVSDDECCTSIYYPLLSDEFGFTFDPESDRSLDPDNAAYTIVNGEDLIGAKDIVITVTIAKAEPSEVENTNTSEVETANSSEEMLTAEQTEEPSEILPAPVQTVREEKTSGFADYLPILIICSGVVIIILISVVLFKKKK